MNFPESKAVPQKKDCHEMEIYSLYKNITTEVKDLYSKQKYGEENSLNFFAQQLNQLILDNNLISDNSVLFVGVKYPYSENYKKNFVILTEKISELNKLPVVYAYYHYKYDSTSFYDDHISRKAHPPQLSKSDKKRYKNSHFIIIEDAIITGTTTEVIKTALIDVSNRLSIIPILDLREKDYIEKELNNYFFEKNGVNGLINLLNSKNYTPTTQLLRTLDLLKKKELVKLLSKISKPKKLIESYKSYTDKDLI